MVLEVPLEAVSSSGWLASEGIKERWAERNGVPTRVATLASTNTVMGCRFR